MPTSPHPLIQLNHLLILLGVIVLQCRSEKVGELIHGHIPGSRLLSDVGTELTYQLPQGESAHFPKMMKDLDKNGTHIGVREYGISITTMEVWTAHKCVWLVN